jgi:hypothetical protein
VFLDSKKGKNNVYQKKMEERNEGLLKKRNRKWEDSCKKKNANMERGDECEWTRGGCREGVMEREKRGESMMMLL